MAELRAKQKQWLLEYKKCGNATAAARAAGYKHPNKQGPENLVKLGKYLHEYEAEIECADIADMGEINEFWTEVLRDERATMKDRLKASELRAKAQGAFVEKREVTLVESEWFK